MLDPSYSYVVLVYQKLYIYQSTVEAIVVHVAWQCKIDMQCDRTITRNAQFKISNDDPILSIL